MFERLSSPVARPAAEPEIPAEQTDHSIEADSVAPEHQGPGDSDGGAPEPPPEAEEQQ